MAFLLLSEILNKNYTNRKVLDEIESVYCDFDHPEEMNEFIIYMPRNSIHDYDFKKYSIEENFAFMVQKFKQFLFKEQQELSKVIN